VNYLKFQAFEFAAYLMIRRPSEPG